MPSDNLEILVNVSCPLHKAFPQLKEGSIRYSDQVTSERLTNEDLMSIWFFTADFPMYHIDGKEAFLDLSRLNPGFENIDDLNVYMVYKRGAVFLVALLLLVSFASASHTATVSTDYTPIYETTSANVSLTVTNSLFSSHKIDNVMIKANDFTILGTFSILGWIPTLLGNEISYYTNDSKISNWGSQTFGVEVKSFQVSQNSTV